MDLMLVIDSSATPMSDFVLQVLEDHPGLTQDEAKHVASTLLRYADLAAGTATQLPSIRKDKAVFSDLRPTKKQNTNIINKNTDDKLQVEPPAPKGAEVQQVKQCV